MSLDLYETLHAILDVLRSEAIAPIPVDILSEIDAKTIEINNQITGFDRHDYSICFFHVPPHENSSVISTFDIKKWDLKSIDFVRLVKLALRVCKWSNPRARIVLFTDDSFLADFNDSAVEIVRLKIDPTQLMFERVKCMVSAVFSKLAARPIIFLDSDALVAAELPINILDGIDILITHRHDLLMVPVNEGVICVNQKRSAYARRFFWRYLSSYLRLIDDPRIQAIYPNIKLWRGGQLALNAAVGGLARYRDGVQVVDGIRVGFYPTSRMNLSVQSPKYISANLWSQSPIVHLKGGRKIAIAQFEDALRELGFCEQ